MMNGRLAYVTLLTNRTYLPGLLVLHYSLKRVGTRIPLVVMITDTLAHDVLEILEQDGLEIYPVQPVEPAEKVVFDAHDARFAETWTKLAVYGLDGFERVVLIDSDMLVLQNMDELFDMQLLPDHIAAVHACTCNPRKLAHYPKDWIPENCAHTYADHTKPIAITPDARPTFHQVNSGLVVLYPSRQVARAMGEILQHDPVVREFRFPDQEFMAYFFKGRFVPLGYQYNALKTLRGCHIPMWEDTQVKNVHYIISPKPWQDRSYAKTEDERILHSWWWETWDEMAPRWHGNAAFESAVLSVMGLDGPLQCRAC